MGERRGTKGLELWCRRCTEGYAGVSVVNMTTSWRDGLAFCALIHHFRPELIEFSKLNKDDVYHNNELAFTIAERQLGIPALLEPEDMVEFAVPDRLSILTYLSQFYRAFAVEQGKSPARAAPKRPSTSPDHGIVSPASTSPPTKVLGKKRREPCAQCGHPVFIAERLNVGKLLYHRTCFRCARCHSQLTLANYYETESNQFCCETCPDEEKAPPAPEVLSRSLSDEEKSAGLTKNTLFENTPRREEEDGEESMSKRFSKARSFFMSQIDGGVVEEEPPDLPTAGPPPLISDSGGQVEPLSFSASSSALDVVTKDDAAECIESACNTSPPTVEDTLSIVKSEDLPWEEPSVRILPPQQLDVSAITVSDDSVSAEEIPPSVEVIADDSIITVSSTTDEPQHISVSSDDQRYPEDLNPFDDPAPNISLNPFGDVDDDEEETTLQTPKPARRKRIVPSTLDQNTSVLYMQRISTNPFDDDDDDDDDKTIEAPKKKIVAAPKFSLTPVWGEAADSPPVPKPRVSRTSLGAPSDSTPFGSTQSLSSTTSSARKKKLAPKPPGDSGPNSLTTSPCPSVNQSPRGTPKLRKGKKAPLPPSSTPYDKNRPPMEVSLEEEKIGKDEVNRNRQSVISPCEEDSAPNKNSYGQWKKKKGQAPARPVPQKRTIRTMHSVELRRELDVIEIQQQGLEKQGVRLEQIIRERCEAPGVSPDDSLPPEVEELVLQLFELVNEKNELFRKQAELMYLRRQQRLEEEHADVEYQIRCIMLQPEANKTDSDKAREEELISRLLGIVERRNEIIECLEMDRVREAEEDDSISNQMNLYTLKKEVECEKQERKKKKGKKLLKIRGHKVDADKDIDEAEVVSKEKVKKKKKFNIF